jgi:phenylalanyl-tRNA synthetase beta chain
MLASHAWLMQLTGLSADPAEVARRFTSAGIEVEHMRTYGAGLERVVIAEVRGMRPHPKRDKLRLVTVFDGSAEHEVVCGAPNVPPAGERVVLAQLGATLPGGLTIAPRDLGGVISSGMLCSARELDAGSDESGIIVLGAGEPGKPGDLAAGALGLHDTVYELGLTPNRADCLGHVGLARELCALFDKPFELPAPPAVARVASAQPELFAQRDAVIDLDLGLGRPAAANQDAALRGVRVDIRDGARCPRYGAALVSGIAVGPSPFWLRHRLHVLGLRAISNAVDVTNYVLLLFGHPIHAFDYDRVRGGRIEVRLAAQDERMRTLDGAERVLTADDLLICDGQGPVALAGVMGGENSEIAPQTQRVLIECAYFDPRSVRRTSKRTGLHTDSSHRFERGVDYADVPLVLAHAAALIAGLGGGTAVAQALDVVAQPIEPRRIHVRAARVEALLGKPLPADRSLHLLRAIGCEVQAGAGGLDAVAPTHRPDITREIDLIEELARLVGYDTLPSVLPSIPPSTEGTPAAIGFVRRLRESAAAGLYEAINYAFLAPHDLRAARASEDSVRIVNPMSEERSTLRTSLLPGLAANLRHAQRSQQKSFAQFEIARVFHPQRGKALPEERHQLGVLLWGLRREWFRENASYDFYDGKAALEAALRPLCGHAPALRIDHGLDTAAPELHPKRRARVFLGSAAIGVLGELHPDTVAALELEGRPVWAMIDVADLAAAIAAAGVPAISALPRFPSATRDLAVVVGEAVPAGDVGDALRAAAGHTCEAVALFDLYRGDPVPAGYKSLAFHLVYRDPEATLTDKVVDELHAKVVRAAEERFGGSVRR